MFLADYDFAYELTNASSAYWTNDSASFDNGSAHSQPDSAPVANWWALSALSLVVATAAGNILVCLAICWERRLQNVTNYFLMSLAVTDLMVAILVMPLGIYTLFRGHFALPSIYCLAWICLDVLFCTASIMHLCTISVDRYLSLRYPMKFGRNKSRRRVILKIIFVWLLSIAMSLPLSLMYSKDQGSLIIDGTCQIPDPLYKFIGSIICFYIPLLVMLVTYALTVRLLANQKQSLGTPDWSSTNWMGGPNALERRCTWRRFFHTTTATSKPGGGGRPKHHHQMMGGTPQHHGGGGHHHHHHSAASTDTELTALDTHDLWIQESEPKPCAMSALGAFGAEMLKLSRGLQEAAAAAAAKQREDEPPSPSPRNTFKLGSSSRDSLSDSRSPLLLSRTASSETPSPRPSKRLRRASTYHPGDSRDDTPRPSPSRHRHRRFGSLHEVLLESSGSTSAVDSTPQVTPVHHRAGGPPGDSLLLLPPPCKCPYFGDQPPDRAPPQPAELKILPSDRLRVMSGGSSGVPPAAPDATPPTRRRSPGGDSSSPNLVVTWESRRSHRRGSSFGTTRSILVANNNNNSSSPSQGRTPLSLRRSATLRQNGHHGVSVTTAPGGGLGDRAKNPSSPCLLQRYAFNNAATGVGGKGIRPHHSRNSSVISRNSSRHGRIIRLEQKATKVLGVVFFTFVVLWAPFFILNLVPQFCEECDKGLENWAVQLVTWLGYASSMVNPVFYTIFNKVFRQAFKKVLTCKYRKGRHTAAWRPHR